MTYGAAFCAAPLHVGTNVVVYGAQTPRPAGNKTAVPPSVTFAIDGVIPMVVVSNPDINATQYATQYFESHTLPAGEHVLEIDVQYGSDDWPFVLDYIEYTPMNVSSTPVSSDNRKRSSHVGPIVGGFIGGVVLVGLVALASWFFYKRRRRPEKLAKKYGHYVSKDAKQKPDLANNFEGEYMAPRNVGIGGIVRTASVPYQISSRRTRTLSRSPRPPISSRRHVPSTLAQSELRLSCIRQGDSPRSRSASWNSPNYPPSSRSPTLTRTSFVTSPPTPRSPPRARARHPVPAQACTDALSPSRPQRCTVPGRRPSRYTPSRPQSFPTLHTPLPTRAPVSTSRRVANMAM